MSTTREFHHLLDAAPDAMIVFDRRGRMTAVNPEAERRFGWPAKDLVGQHMSRVLPTRFQLLLEPLGWTETIVNDRSAGNDTFDCVALRRDGSSLPVELSRCRIGTGRSAHSLLTLRDRRQFVRLEMSDAPGHAAAGPVPLAISRRDLQPA